MKRLLVPVVLLVVLAGCGARGGEGAQVPVGNAPSVTLPVVPPSASAPVGTPPPAVVTTGPSGVVVPQGVTELPAEQVDTKTLPADQYVERRVWVGADDRTVQFFAIAPDPCTRMEASVREADAGKVVIGIAPMAERQGGPEGQVCATVITAQGVSVTLDEALGERQVVLTVM